MTSSGESAPDAYGVDAGQVDERMHVLAIRCGVTLDPEEDPVTFGDVRRAAADVCALQAAIAHAPRVLPEGLATYLARSWQIHVEPFDRACKMSELEIAAGWARRHAEAARSVLAMPEDDVVAPLHASTTRSGKGYRCTCTADHCYWDTSDHPVDSGELCLHCHYLGFNEVCPAREEAELAG